MGIKLKEAMDKLDLECHWEYSGGPKDKSYNDVMAFILKKLGVVKTSGQGQ